MEQRQQNTNNNNPKENIHTLRHLFAKLDKQEVTNFGNYCVNFNEMFPKEEESKENNELRKQRNNIIGKPDPLMMMAETEKKDIEKKMKDQNQFKGLASEEIKYQPLFE